MDAQNSDIPDYGPDIMKSEIARKILGKPSRLLNAIGGGKTRVVREVLAFGCDPNVRTKKGNTMLIRAVRGCIVEASVVEALIEYGADPSLTDPEGFTALDHARRRLAKYEGRPRKPPRRSPSLTPQGNIKLTDFENAALDRVHREHPDFADEYEASYLEARREAAERVFDTRGNLEKIVPMLERVTPRS